MFYYHEKLRFVSLFIFVGIYSAFFGMINLLSIVDSLVVLITWNQVL